MTIVSEVDTAAAVWAPVCRLDRSRADVGRGRARARAAGRGRPAAGRHACSRSPTSTPSTGAVRDGPRHRRLARAGRPTIASPLHKDVYDLRDRRVLHLRRPPPRALARPGGRRRGVRGLRAVAGRRLPRHLGPGRAPSGRRPRCRRCGMRDRELDVSDTFVDVQQPDVPETLAAVRPEQEITIVPLLLSAGYHVKVDLAEAAAGSPSTAGVTGALGPDARLADVLARRLVEAGLSDGDRVVLAAAGSTRRGRRRGLPRHGPPARRRAPPPGGRLLHLGRRAARAGRGRRDARIRSRPRRSSRPTCSRPATSRRSPRRPGPT